MNRFAIVRLGAPSLVALLLAACSGGGGSGSTTHTVLPSTPSTGPSAAPSPSAAPAGTGLRLKFSIHRGTPTQSAAAKKRSPKYISRYVQGMQITVASASTSQTIYMDTSASNTADCSNENGDVLACTIALPILANTETVSAIETDQLPTDENPTTFTGDGFPDGTYPASKPATNILATGSGTATVAPGVTTVVSITLNPVIGAWTASSGNSGNGNAMWADSQSIVVDGCSSALTEASIYDGNQNYCTDPLTNTIRVAVTPGSPQLNGLEPVFEDRALNQYDYDDESEIAAPFVDVDGTATPATVTSGSSHLTFNAYPNTNFAGSLTLPSASASAPAGYGASTSIPNDGYEFSSNYFVIGLNYDGSTPSLSGQLYDQATLSNGLSHTATLHNPQDGNFTVGPYPVSAFIDVVPVQAYPSAETVSISGNNGQATGSVTGYDWGASYNQFLQISCSNGTALSSGVNNEASLGGGQFDEVVFSLTPSGSPGSCTVNVMDGYTLVPSNTLTVTVNS
ncbi:MAG: hypothetical protein ABR975_06520 [Vulcanimicrobiaceae bacterium]|jgi:hypothetical protein